MNYKSGLQTNKNRLYRIWVNMKSRCYNPNASRYKHYGGNGICICAEWLDDYINFHNWAVSNGYKDNLSIDRINPDGNYEPSNCRWTTAKIQNRNKKNVPIYKYENVIFTQSEVFEKFGIKRTTFQQRLKRGLTIAEAIERG